ncbi:MscS family membrane protein [Pedobacter sp. CAN_A7]|uniref:mechanosensitive ion channel family protein n=1 Tax=Pedobacter sp. CAN_A7 TaxID=2787722 RepID=UPI0018CB8EEB
MIITKAKYNFPEYFYSVLFFCSFLLLCSNFSQAQDTTSVTDSSIINKAPVWPADSLGRRTPRGTVEGFLKAATSQKFIQAQNYLNLDSSFTGDKDKYVRALQHVIETSGNIYPYSWISNELDGKKDDDLGPELDKVGEITINDKSFDLMLEHLTDSTGAPIWLFSAQTIKSVPIDSIKVAQATLVEKAAPGFLLRNLWAGVPIAHWLGLIVLVVIAYYLAGAITKFLVFFIPLVWRKARQESTAGIIQSFVKPIQLYLGVWLFVVGSRQVGISLLIRQRLSDLTILVGLAAILLLIWQLIDFISKLMEKRMRLRDQTSGVSALLFFRRTAKVALVILGMLAILDTLGFNVTTWLATLGIVGIALALGTQKTVENLVGSVTLIADHPIRVGDFCKAGDVTGTVEQIGMRTTQIRTGERTVVSIPNGDFSSMKIENFAPRDKFLFASTFGMRYETTPEQIRYLLVALRSMLYAHPKVDPAPARVQLVGLGAHSIDIEIWTYISTRNNDEFMEIREDLLLRIMDIVAESGTDFAFPSQTLYFAKDKGISEEKTAAATASVKQWRKSNDIQLPHFSLEQIEKLRNTLPYPPEGSVSNKT